MTPGVRRLALSAALVLGRQTHPSQRITRSDKPDDGPNRSIQQVEHVRAQVKERPTLDSPGCGEESAGDAGPRYKTRLGPPRTRPLNGRNEGPALL